MKASQFFVSTLKEAPADAEVVSHRLMLRAGMIKRLCAGIYSYMPMGLRVIRKVEAIIREEMNRAGAVELLMPVVQPAELWQESGRFQAYGPELLRVKDRHERDFIIQPTSEEVITDIARQELRSYKQLPRNFYHIQTKFRDERRPRFGIMRGREFTMKDAYSFDRDKAAALRSYEVMYQAYCRIFDRFGLQYRAVAADTGAIGGDASHEFQVIADTGEDAIVYCTGSDYAANIELAEALPLIAAARGAVGSAGEDAHARQVHLRGRGRAAGRAAAAHGQVAGAGHRRDVDAGDLVKTTVWLLLVRGDHSLNEIKAGKVEGLKGGFRFATVAEIERHFGCKPGYLGPIGTALPVKVVADRTVAAMHDFICGANDEDFHYTGVNWGRDLPEPDLVADIRNVVAGDPSPDGQGVLAIQRGIEVGHVFYLGTKYSKSMNATFLDESGQAAADGNGLLRHRRDAHPRRGHRAEPRCARHRLAGCDRAVHGGAVPDRLRPQRRGARARPTRCTIELAGLGIDVVLDDRGERPGAMFADWELIGIPQRVVISERGLKEGQLEVQGRREPQAASVPLAEGGGLPRRGGSPHEGWSPACCWG